uniref:Uncharacterized protein n=1 Tax=Anguilla anguilla TaxID=7936 RepID=A0A0E9QQF8_ANGAN
MCSPCELTALPRLVYWPLMLVNYALSVTVLRSKRNN